MAYIPKKTIKGYKLFKMKKSEKGKLFPLYVAHEKEGKKEKSIPVGKWVDATEGERGVKGVKSKLGELAYRPGWHGADYPIAIHIGKKGDQSSKPVFRPDDQVWAECDFSADVDYKKEALANASMSKSGNIIQKTAQLDKLPVHGYYRYKTNPNMFEDWIIAGHMKINKILTDEEVEKINKKIGKNDLPREKPLNLKEYGF